MWFDNGTFLFVREHTYLGKVYSFIIFIFYSFLQNWVYIVKIKKLFSFVYQNLWVVRVADRTVMVVEIGPNQIHSQTTIYFVHSLHQLKKIYF